ncbi:MAG: Gfo/Idh/MocA family oxidoreductase [Treponema sp.]|jgi:predicted dehydrogenase|nr:Gfo/Idh/MocA family oxidoreductase [Treponema sp.]
MAAKKLRIGIIGCGGIANQKHFPSLQANADKCEIVAFCDLVEERAVTASKKYGAANAVVYTNYKDLLKNESIDVVHVLTPNVAHCQISVDAFAAGKHVLCEKPMASTTEDAQKMIDAWKKSGKQFTIGYQNRFRPEVQALYKSCAAGELGEIYYAKASAVRRRAVPTWGVFPNKALQGGGPLIDIGTHALDLTLWMMNNYEPESVTGSVFYKLGSLPEAVDGNVFGPWDPKTFEVEDSAFGYIKMKNGAAIMLESSWALNVLDSREASTALCGTKAGAEIRSGMSYPVNELHYARGKNGLLMDERIASSGSVAYFSGGANEPGVVEARQWLTAVAKNKAPLVRPEQAFLVTKILDSIYKSAAARKEILF